MTLGLRRAGFKVLGGVDIDPLALKTYRANHRGVRLWHRDIRAMDAHEILTTLRLKRGELDLVGGCPPCQGFSTMTTLNGRRRIDDPRNDLVKEFGRLIKDLLPRAVMMENVPGLARDGRFDKLLGLLEHELAYKVAWDVTDAASYGVPQRRRRLVLVAHRGRPVTLAPPQPTRITVRDAISTLPPAGKSNDAIHDLPENRTPKIRRLIAKIPKDGGSRTDLPNSYQLRCHRICNGFKDVYGRMAWDAVAPTITSGCFNPSKGRFLHPTEDRAITMREAALLQSFPKDYIFASTDNKGALANMIGNALPPEFIRQHALLLKDDR